MSDLTFADMVDAPSIPQMVALRRRFWPLGTYPRCTRCVLYFGHEYDGLGHGSEGRDDG